MMDINPFLAGFIILAFFGLLCWGYSNMPQGKRSSTMLASGEWQESSILVADKKTEENYTNTNLDKTYIEYRVIGGDDAVYNCNEEIWNSLKIGKSYNIFESGMGYSSRLTIERVVSEKQMEPERE